MAKIKAGILSKVSGKVAGVVGGTWKGTNYIRELVKPSNPNTALQQAQRGKMAFVVATARQLVGDILNPYLNKFCKTMSGYNWFCKENISKLGGSPLAFTSAPVLSFGTLGSGSFDFTDASLGEGAKIATVPTIAAGHTAKLVSAIILENGSVLAVNIVNNPTVNGLTGGAGTLTEGTYKYYIACFFADFDANGVLQQLSASVTSALITETVN